MSRDKLREIEEQKREEVEAEKSAARHRQRPFEEALCCEGLSVIAQIHRRSPTKGVIAEIPDPMALARQYVEGGAAAISVLTDGPRFGGSFEDLRAVSQGVALPTLCKDFIIDPLQLVAARDAGAADRCFGRRQDCGATGFR